jgi:hypothetical protein
MGPRHRCLCPLRRRTAGGEVGPEGEARYPDHSPEAWYFFCKRTGHGNLAAAREKVERYLTEHANRPDLQIDEYGGCFYWLDGRLDQAKASLARAYQTRTSISAALALAMIADGERDTDRRDALISELLTKHRDKARMSLAICQILDNKLFVADGKLDPLDVAAVDRVLMAMPVESRGNAEFFVGWFLKNNDDPARAKIYLKRAFDSGQTLNWYHYLAKDALVGLGEKRAARPLLGAIF